ncbi:MAG TPA: nitrilase-related carbon-nitrogen hydrolase, partial [Acidimicrobiales bacterium]|nr:nitrilase-related carbon-nitrogen hydrolase [Acidimicrobiales bacterium]
MRDRLLLLAAALATGLALAAALPPWGWWPLAFVGLVALDRLIADRSRGSRWRRGALVGLGLYVPSLAWLLDMTMPGYVIAVLAYAALFGGAMAVVPAASPARWVALPGAIALAELLRWSWPFGGVPLSSLAVGQVSGPLAPVLRLGGALLLVEVTVIAGVAIAALLSRRWLAGGLAAGVVVAVTVAGALAPDGRQVGTLDVAVVQGGGPQGTRASDTDERLVFERHLDATQGVETPVDLVVWPEDVVDTEGPVESNREGTELSDLARELDATLIAGVVEGVDRESFRNASQAYDADGRVVDRYDKVHRVPFGEYVPLRSLIENFAGDSLTSREAVIGDVPAELDTSAGRLSVAISW